MTKFAAQPTMLIAWSEFFLAALRGESVEGAAVEIRQANADACLQPVRAAPDSDR